MRKVLIIVALLLTGCMEMMSPEELTKVDQYRLLSAYASAVDNWESGFWPPALTKQQRGKPLPQNVQKLRDEIARRDLFTIDEWQAIDSGSIFVGMRLDVAYAIFPNLYIANMVGTPMGVGKCIGGEVILPDRGRIFM